MPGHPFHIESDVTAFTAAFDLFELVPASDQAIELQELQIGQTTDLGDAAEETLMVSIILGHATSGNGSSITPVDVWGGAATAQTTCEEAATTIASTGTTRRVAFLPWNIRIPLIWTPTPENRIIVPPSVRAVVRISAPADSVTAFGSLVFTEMGS